MLMFSESFKFILKGIYNSFSTKYAIELTKM